jgi:hypothetical protein
MTQKLKQIIIAVVIIVIAFFAIRSFTREPVTDSATVSQTAKAQFVDGREILLLLNRLNTVSLKEDIFSSATFLSLYNFEQPIADETPGRQNPFAPLGTANLVVGNTTRPGATTTPIISGSTTRATTSPAQPR